MATKAESFRDNVKARIDAEGWLSPYVKRQLCTEVDKAYKQFIDPSYPVPPEGEKVDPVSEAGRTLNQARKR